MSAVQLALVATLCCFAETTESILTMGDMVGATPGMWHATQARGRSEASVMRVTTMGLGQCPAVAGID